MQEWINKKAQERVRDEMVEGDNEKNEVIEVNERAEEVKDGGAGIYDGERCLWIAWHQWCRKDALLAGEETGWKK